MLKPKVLDKAISSWQWCSKAISACLYVTKIKAGEISTSCSLKCGDRADCLSAGNDKLALALCLTPVPPCLRFPHLCRFVLGFFQLFLLLPARAPHLSYLLRETIMGHVFLSLWSLSSLSACWLQGLSPPQWLLQKRGHTYLASVMLMVESICWCWKRTRVCASACVCVHSNMMKESVMAPGCDHVAASCMFTVAC